MSDCGDGIKSIKGCMDAILSIRGDIGAALHDVFIVTRTWTGAGPGDGEASDTEEQVLPTPGIQDFSHNIRLMDAGAVKSGDIILKDISKNKYATELEVNCRTDSQTVEKFYRVGDSLYQCISVVEKLLYWNVQLRRMSNQERFN